MSDTYGRPGELAGEILRGNQDAFENEIGNRTNVIDLASHYPYTPERWTVEVNGTRQLLQYNSVSQYNHAGNRHELKPAAGDTVVFESAESPRYVVSYELAATFAFGLNQSLTTGDSIKVGLYDGTDGWYFEQDGSHTDTTGDFVAESGGTEVYRESDIDLVESTQTFARLKLQTAWYDITRQLWERSFSDSGTQQNETLGTFSGDGQAGPERGNLPLHFEVTADSGTTGLVLEAGSAAQVNLGRTTQLTRTKVTIATDTIDATGTWVPLRAYRIDPGREVVNTQINDIEIGSYSVSDDVELLVNSFDKSKIKDSGGNALVDSDFSTPNDFSGQNNIIEATGAVEQFPDDTGTVGTSATNPGGWQLGRAELFSGSGNTLSGTTSVPPGVKRPFYSRDYAVVLGKSASTGDVTYQLQVEQDW